MASSRNNTLQFSSAGSVIVSNGAAGAGSYGAIQILKDSTLSSLSGTGIDNIASLETAFTAGTIIYGQFTNGTVDSSGLAAFHRV